MSSLSAITVGNFDGVHQGHAALVHAARKRVGENGHVKVLSFDPHPISILRPEGTPPRLSRFDQRSQWLKDLGADEVERLVPDPEFLHRSPQDFVKWLIKNHKPGIVVEGPDFRFGKSRKGTVETLQAMEAQGGYETIVIDPVEMALSDGQIVRVSSTMVRWLIAHGRVRDARHLLGHPYELSGEVVSGDRRGRTIGVPTANLDHGDLLLPSDGVYAGQGRLPDGSVFPAAISVGRKPTFDQSTRLCEAHLLGYDGPFDNYGWTLKIEFREWIRDQVTFSGVDALVDQLKRDIESVRSMNVLMTS
ncbi:MAG: riboflavin biosynthesis protein RibF [Planctomycetota bacterium]|nr:riboflavin biosynthesis protein RibF [Planctomycetota bacterium]